MGRAASLTRTPSRRTSAGYSFNCARERIALSGHLRSNSRQFCFPPWSSTVPAGDPAKNLISEHQIRTVVDLGCGDFRVGRLLCAQCDLQDVGADVIPDLIAYNQSRFGGPQEFRCANLIDDELPDGELCLIRQVLQHLSNAEISRVLAKCAKYRVVLVTEEVFTKPGSRPNLDIAHGPDNRASDNSGVFLNLPPFSFMTTPVLEIPIPGDLSVMRTVMVEGLSDSRSRVLRESA
jgi:SAM-dependent methyltransferase